MGFFSDILFGTNSAQEKNSRKNSGHRKPHNNGWNLFGSDYDDYYEELHSDALLGDTGAADEMEDEFGDGWEGEY